MPRKILAAGVALLPRSLVLKAYYGFLHGLVFTISAGRWQVWARNSMALGYHSQLSDLDLTLFSSQQVPPPFLVWWARKWARLGEWAVYTQADSHWAAWANPLELERDPKLEKKFGARPAQRDECLAFWLRQIEGDRFLRTDQIELRAAKWNFHRQQVQRRVPLKASSGFPGFLEEIAASLSSGSVSLNLALSEDNSDEQAILRPHRWLWRAKKEKKETREILANLWQKEMFSGLRSLTRAQIQWEAWGLLGQVRLNRNYEEVLRHLAYLAEMLPAGDALREEMAEFLRYLEMLQRLSLPLKL